jgi:hypothetical protein
MALARPDAPPLVVIAHEDPATADGLCHAVEAAGRRAAVAQPGVAGLAAAFSTRVGCVKAFMQLVGTREAGRQAGRVGAPGLAEPRQPESDRRMDQAVRAQALGVGDVGCSARHTSGGPVPGDHG